MPRQREFRLRNHGEPMEITVRYECRCPQTGILLNRGDKAVYFPKGGKCYSLESEAARLFLARRNAESVR